MSATQPSIKSKRYRLDVDLESDEPLALEYVRAIATAILESNDNVVGVRIYDRDYKIKK